MAETYFVVINKEAYPSDSKSGGKTIASSEIVAPGLSSAKVVSIVSPAGTVAEAQKIVGEAYPGLVTGTPVVVTEAQWKLS